MTISVRGRPARLALVGLCALTFAPAAPAAARPVYVVAHRCNTVQKAKEALDAGANAIECDVRKGKVTAFAKPGWYVDHDGAFAWSTKLDEWLTGVAALAKKHPQRFALILLDIKTPEADALVELHRLARAKLPANLNLLFSIGSFDDRKAFAKLKGKLGPNDGVTIDAENDPTKVQKFFADELKVGRFWYGNGIFVAGVKSGLEPSIKKATALRDSEKKIKKVHVWTLAAQSSIERYVKEHRVDGVLVNPGTIKTATTIIARHARMATRSDPAFVRHVP